MQGVSAELYYNYTLDALSRGGIKEVLQIWENSLSMGSTGVVLRTAIKNKIPEMAAMYDLQVTEKTTLKDILVAYREQKMRKRCARGPEHCLR